LPGRKRESCPDRASRTLEEARTNPAVLDRRVDIGRVRGRAAHARETKLAVVGHFDRAGFFTELQDSCVAQREPRLIEGVEILKDQQRHRLTQIERRLAHRTEQIAGIKFGNAHPSSREVGGSHHHRGLQRTAQAREIHAGVNVRRIVGPNKNGVRRGLRPAGKIGGAKIGCVELRPSDLGDAVDAAHARCSGVPGLSSRQRLARRESRFLS